MLVPTIIWGCLRWRGADDEALMWYRRSLALAEELGNRAGMAAHTSKSVCCLRHEVSRTSLSLGLLRSWLVHVELGSPEIHLDLYGSRSSARCLGRHVSLDILREQLSEDDVQCSYVCSTTLLPVYKGRYTSESAASPTCEAFQAVQHVSMCYPTIVGFKHEVVETILPAQLRYAQRIRRVCQSRHGWHASVRR